jgi:Ca2+-dependent lipid-binding protein
VQKFLQLPLLNDAIRSIINAQMANMCVLPNSMVIPLVPEVNINRLFVPLPDGVIRIKVVEAGNLENKDVSFIVKDKSDPYCELQLGSQLYRTRTINNNLDPKFDEYFEVRLLNS